MEIEDFDEKIGGAKKDLWKERNLFLKELKQIFIKIQNYLIIHTQKILMDIGKVILKCLRERLLVM